MLKVVHFCYRFLPDRGGSETYTSSLIRELKRRSVSSTIISEGEPIAQYIHDGVPVYRLGFRNYAADGSSEGRSGFSCRAMDVVRTIEPDIVHFHLLPDSATTFLLPELRRCGIHTAWTYHHPSLTCQRGDMLRFGQNSCTGNSSETLCYPCATHALGAPRAISHGLTLVPQAIQSCVARVLPKSRVKTAFAFRAKLRSDIQNRLAFLHALDHVFVLSEWSRKQLVGQGVRPERISLSRLGTHHDLPAGISTSSPADRPLRGIFVGRMDRAKGIHLVAAAFAQQPDIQLTIDTYGPSEGLCPGVLRLIQCKAVRSRLRLRGLLRAEEVVNTMSRYDFAVVPSQGFETGPYVAIEAFEAGVPVVASDVPALNELINHNNNGWLVPLHSAQAWADVFQMLDRKPELLYTWKQQARWTRSMRDVADEVARCYARLVEADAGVTAG